jgi:hypothetical protein
MADETAANPPSFNLIGQDISDLSFEYQRTQASIMLG